MAICATLDFTLLVFLVAKNIHTVFFIVSFFDAIYNSVLSFHGV